MVLRHYKFPALLSCLLVLPHYKLPVLSSCLLVLQHYKLPALPSCCLLVLRHYELPALSSCYLLALRSYSISHFIILPVVLSAQCSRDDVHSIRGSNPAVGASGVTASAGDQTSGFVNGPIWTGRTAGPSVPDSSSLGPLPAATFGQLIELLYASITSPCFPSQGTMAGSAVPWLCAQWPLSRPFLSGSA